MIYLDDILIMGQSEALTRDHTLLVLEGLGFIVNYPKSQLSPSQQIEFLGFMIDSRKKELSLPKEKLDSIRKEASCLLKKDSKSDAWEVYSSNLGSASSPHPLHYRSLQALNNRALHAVGYDGAISMSAEAKEDLEQPARLEWKEGSARIPDGVIQLILSSWREKTNANYNSAWRKWERWCQGEAIVPFQQISTLCLGYSV